MGWVSKKVFAILNSSEEGKDILEGIGDKDQETVNKEVDAFFKKSGQTKPSESEEITKKEFKPQNLEQKLSNDNLDALYDKTGGDEDAILTELRKDKEILDNIPNGDLQGIVEAYMDKKTGTDMVTRYLEKQKKSFNNNNKDQDIMKYKDKDGNEFSFERWGKYYKVTKNGKTFAGGWANSIDDVNKFVEKNNLEKISGNNYNDKKESNDIKLSESDTTIVDDAIYWVKKEGKPLTVDNVFKQLDEDMKGFTKSGDKRIINYLNKKGIK